MARKTLVVTIVDENRDKGSRYLITEMSASRAERWAIRALMGMAKSGVAVPDDVVSSGMAGLARFGFTAISGMAFADAEPLLDEMMGCVQAMPNPSDPSVTRALIEDDVQEVTTRLRLRKEVFQLHVGFFTAGVAQTLT